MKQRIYIFGNAQGSHRARELIYFLSSSFMYATAHQDPGYFAPRNRSFPSRLYGLFLRFIDRILNLHKLLLADLLFILPMARLTRVEMQMAKLCGVKIIGEFYISNYDTEVNDRRTVAANSRRAKRLLRADQSFVDYCDKLVFLNRSESDYYLSLVARSSARDKVVEIPLCSPEHGQARLPYANRQAESISLVWWGTYIPLHGLEKILRAVAILGASDLEFHLDILGAGSFSPESYQRLVRELEIESVVTFHGDVTFADGSLQSLLLEKADIAFGNFGDSEKAKTVLVNKVVEAASFGLPIVSQRTKAAGEFFTHGENICFAEATPRGIAYSVEALAKNSGQLLTLGRSAHALHERWFSNRHYVSEISKILRPRYSSL